MDPLHCAFGYGRISSRDFGRVSVLLLAEGVDRQPIDQSPMNEETHLCILLVFGEFQVQLTDLSVQACLLHNCLTPWSPSREAKNTFS
jgi:hypothetical protein